MEHSLHDISRTLSVKVIKVDATFQTLTITLPIHVWSSISYYFPSIAINWPKSDLALIFPNLQTQKKTVSWTLRNLMNLRTDPRWFVLCRSGFRPKAVNTHRSRRFFVIKTVAVLRFHGFCPIGLRWIECRWMVVVGDSWNHWQVYNSGLWSEIHVWEIWRALNPLGVSVFPVKFWVGCSLPGRSRISANLSRHGDPLAGQLTMLRMWRALYSIRAIYEENGTIAGDDGRNSTQCNKQFISLFFACFFNIPGGAGFLPTACAPGNVSPSACLVIET